MSRSSSRFAGIRSLLAGTSLGSPREDDEPQGNIEHEEEAQAPRAPRRSAGASIDARELDDAVAGEITNAVKANNDRWNKVMTSDAGAANPKAAAKLLMSGNGALGADEIVATLEEFGGAPPAAKGKDDQPGADAGDNDRRMDAQRNRLRNNAEANPDTGGAGGGREQRRGEGEGPSAIAAHRAKTAERRNAAAKKAGGKNANADA